MKKSHSFYDEGPGPVPDGEVYLMDIEQIRVAAWCPDKEAEEKPLQVHVVFTLRGFALPFLLRFTGPGTLTALIEQLTRYRDYVWPEAAEQEES